MLLVKTLHGVGITDEARWGHHSFTAVQIAIARTGAQVEELLKSVLPGHSPNDELTTILWRAEIKFLDLLAHKLASHREVLNQLIQELGYIEIMWHGGYSDLWPEGFHPEEMVRKLIQPYASIEALLLERILKKDSTKMARFLRALRREA